MRGGVRLLIVAVVAAGLCVGSTVFSQNPSKTAALAARLVYVLSNEGEPDPETDQTPRVRKGSVVRVTAEGVAGSTFKVEITGPARVADTSDVVRVFRGQIPMGGVEREYALQTTGLGEVTATILVKHPEHAGECVYVERFIVE